MIRPDARTSTARCLRSESRRFQATAGTLLLLILLAACSGSGGIAAGGPSGATAPGAFGAPTAEQAVEGFLGALRAHDYPAMGRYFGTRDGPAREKWGVEEVEQRMLVLAGVLEHETADLRPARRSITYERRRQFVLTLTGTRYGTVTLRATAVRAGSGRWFVERIDTSGLNP